MMPNVLNPTPDKPEIANYKHQITNKFQISISNKIKSQLFGSPAAD